jgi:hypothetical protein
MNKIMKKRKTTEYVGQNTLDGRKKKQNWNFHSSWKKKQNHKRWIRSGLTINVKKWPSEPVAGRSAHQWGKRIVPKTKKLSVFFFFRFY